MTAHSLITAVTVGLVAGLAGRTLIRRDRFMPLWLPVAAGVSAAVLASVISRMVNTQRPAPNVTEIALQVLFAVTGVALVAMTADRQPTDPGWRHTGDKTGRPR